MSYVIQASPLSKIFMPEWEQKCVADPTLVGKSEPGLFEVRIPRSAGGLILSHLRPVHVSTLIAASKDRKVEEDEITPLVAWLTGGPDNHPCEETDIYGVVLLDVGNQFQSALQGLVEMQMDIGMAGGDENRKKEIAKKQQKMQQDIAEEIRTKSATATERANARVRKALTHTHNNLLKSWESLKAEGKGTYQPSPQEALGYHIMKLEIDRALEQNRKLYNDVAAGIPGASRA
jgi:hypothetical protein